MSIPPVRSQGELRPSNHTPPDKLNKAVRAHYPPIRPDGTPRNLACILISKGQKPSTTFIGTDSNGNKINENTQFRLGSFSKFITGLAVDLLVQDSSNNLNYDTQLCTVFSKQELKLMFDSNEYDFVSKITLQQLIDQRSGIENMGPPELQADFKLDLSQKELQSPVTSELLRQSQTKRLKLKDGFTPQKPRFNYSNLNATLVGAIMERVTGEPFQKIMQECIFEPFGLRDTGYDSPETTQKPYAKSFNLPINPETGKPAFSDSHFFDPSGHIWTSPKDMSTLFSKLSSDRSLTQSLRSKVSQDGPGLNYRHFSICNGNVIGHNGGRDGYGSVGFIDISSGKAIIVLENDNVQNVDENAAPIAKLFGIQSYHGDPSAVIN